MDEETSYYEIRRICEESRTHLTKRLFETGAVDKKGNIIKKDKWAEIHTEKEPYTALWNQYFDKFERTLQFSNKDFSYLYFNSANSLLEWDCTNCNFTHSIWEAFFSFGKSRFSQCNFTETYFDLIPRVKDTTFFECDFSKATLHNIWEGTFRKCNFNNAELYHIFLKNERPFFDNCNFQGCSIIFEKTWDPDRTPKEITADITKIFSPEQLSCMNIKFPGYSIFSKLF